MDCPSEVELLEFCDSRGAADNQRALLDHVSECTDCQGVIEKFCERDAAVSGHLLIDFPVSELLQERLGKLKLQRPSPESEDVPQFADLGPWIEEGDTEIGRVGRYELIRCIGRGGMGVVFEAFDRELQRAVAVKMMSPSLLVNPANSKRFRREAQAAAAIRHPSVVTIYGVDQSADLPFLIMELIDGESLQQRLDRDSKIELDQAVEIAAKLASGLAAAHDCGVVHRDVKPANVLIQSDTSDVKLTDFGLALTETESLLTRSGTLLGTPEYLAPEQIDGARADSRSDLFSLGSVIYHMCIGKPPFEGASIVATLRDVVSGQPNALASVDESIPRWLSDTVQWLHAKDPAKRPPNAWTVVETLTSRGTSHVSSRYVPKSRSYIKNLVWTVGVLAMVASLTWAAMSWIPSQSTDRRLIAESVEDLERYLEEHPDDDLIVELVSETPYLLPPIELVRRSLTLIASSDEDVVLILRQEPDQPSIFCQAGDLRLQRLTIQVLAESENWTRFDDDARAHDEDEEELEGFEADAVISCVDSDLELDGCQIVAQTGPCLELVASNATLVDTRFRAPGRAVVCELDDANRIRLESCHFQCESSVDFVEDAVGSLVLVDSVFESNIAIECVDGGEASERIMIKASGNHFDCADAMVAVYQAETRLLSARSFPFEWEGSDNELPEFPLIFFDDDDREQRVNQSEWLRITNR